jgi:hypothetical protein
MLVTQAVDDLGYFIIAPNVKPTGWLAIYIKPGFAVQANTVTVQKSYKYLSIVYKNTQIIFNQPRSFK